MNPVLSKICFFLILCSFLYSQEEKVVAKIGNYKIYESEFSERFDFSVHPKLLQKADTLEVKLEFLKELIAEKLLSLEAEDKGLGSSEYINNVLTPLQNMFVRDALYKNEIKDKVSYSQKDIKEGIERIKRTLKLRFIFSNNEEEIKQLYTHLKSGASFDSVLSLRKGYSTQDSAREITFGTMEKEIEDEVYKLKIGEFSYPLKSKDGFYILKLVDISSNKNLQDPENTIEDVKRIIERRIEYKTYLDYYHNFFSKHKASADKEIFEELIKIFVPGFKEKYLIENSEKDDNKLYLRGIEVSNVLASFSDDLKNKEFIKLQNKTIKIGYFINQLSQEGLFVQDLNEKSIRSSLSSYIRKFIEDELITTEAINKGFQNSADVKKYMSMWKDSYISHMLMLQLMDSVRVPEEEIYSIYSKNEWKETSPQLVNVVEVLTDKLEVIETIIKELSNGKDIRELANQYTIRDSVKNRNGEFGLIPITKLGEIGKYVYQMNVGDIYGPIKLEEGYSIFKLIDRKADTTTYTKSFNEVKNDLTKLITLQRFEKYINEFNAKLANKYGVEIYEDVLNQIDNSFLNLVIVRYMGFGGEIFAVPYTEQFSGWYNQWLQDKKLAQ
jgi:parvulin-like peptidyl-prolyl isomerase